MCTARVGGVQGLTGRMTSVPKERAGKDQIGEADLAAQRAPGALPFIKRETTAEVTPPMDPATLAMELLAPPQDASSLCSECRIYHRQEDETSACFKGEDCPCAVE